MSALNNAENNGESSNSKRSSLSVLSTLDPKMKYLISHLEKNREKSYLSDNELKMLLTDVRSIGSRYADSDRVNQAMLYEAIDKVLNNLKNYLPYSSPFQKKVNQKDAPDYNEVIKNPMDLGTIAKKLKNRAYNSKDEFANDLYLIYTNCITYNTHPDNIFRKYAIAMKKKMDELLEAVPDVKIQTLAEYKASLKQDNGELFKTEKKSPSLDQLTESASSASLQVEDEPPGTDAGTEDVQIADMTGHSQASQENSSDDEEKEADREVQEMLKSIRLIRPTPKLSELWDPELDNPNRDKFFDPNYDPSTDLPTLDQYPQLQFPKKGTGAMIEKNIEILKQSRILHAKLVSARHNIPLSHLGISDKPPEETSIINTTIDQKDLPPLNLNKEAGFACMQRVVSRLCQHAGFEATSGRALTILTEVAQDYFLNLSKTLRAYMDDYSKKMTTEEMINHSLYENGVSSVKNLESYIHDDIQRYGTKLHDIKRRLEAALLQPEEVMDDIPDNDDAFLTGVFGGELQDDFFGFKELGLGPLQVPPQLILGSKRIKPLPKKASEQNEQQLPRHVQPPPWAPITDPESQVGLLREFFRNKKNDSINDQIIEDENLPAKHRNQRPRVPPTGKIPPQPKRQQQKSSAQSAAALAEKKKKKERDAAIAKEKERIKLLKVEERERKKAEKNEQKRQKQLEKEAAKKAEAEAKEARKAELELQKRLAQEAKEAKKLEQEAQKKAEAEAKKGEPKKKKSTSSKTGKFTTSPQAEVSSSSAASSASSKKVHYLDIDSEMVPLGQLKKQRRSEVSASKPTNRSSPTAKKRVPHG